MRKSRFYVSIMLAALLLVIFCGTALADRYDDFVEAVGKKTLTLTEGTGIGQDTPASLTKEDFLEHDKEIQFVDLPGGGFIAVWGEVTILDDQPQEHTITPHPENSSQFILAGEGLIETASSPTFAGGKTLIINRNAAGEIGNMTIGGAHSFDAETGIVSMAESTEDPHPLNYIVGYQAGNDPASALAVNGLLRARGSQLPFDLKNIPIDGSTTVDLKGYFEVDGSCPSADFWPWEFDVRASCTVKMHVDSFDLHFTSPSVNATFDVIPIRIPIIPEVVSIDCSPKFFISGMVDGQLDFGFEFTLGGELHIDSSFDASFNTIADSDSWLNSAEVRSEVYVGLNFGAAIDIAQVCALGLNYKVGLVAEAKLFTNKQEGNSWHACKDFECLQGNVHPRKGPLTVDLDVLDGLLTQTLTTVSEATDYDPLLYFYDSFTFNSGFHLKQCPHYAYRLDVLVANPAGAPVEGAVVSCTPCDDQYASVGKKATTNSEGIATLYIPAINPADPDKSSPGYAVTLSASLGAEGQEAVTSEPLSFTERGMDKDGKLLDPKVTLTLAVPSYTVEWYAEKEDGKGFLPDPIKTETRISAPGSTVAVKESDQEMITREGRFGTESGNKDKAYYLFDEQADNVLSGTVQEDGSLKLKLYFRRAGMITFDPNGGTGEMDPIYAIFGRFVELPPCTFRCMQDEMTFQGWDVFAMIHDPGLKVALTWEENELLVVKAAWKKVEFGTPDFILPAELTAVAAEAFRGTAASRIAVSPKCASIEAAAFADIDHDLYLRVPKECAIKENAFGSEHKVYLFSQYDSGAEAYCRKNENCIFVYWSGTGSGE